MSVMVVDTNYLVRIITNDNPILAQRALEVVLSHKPRSIVLKSAVVAEVVYVLTGSYYQWTRQIVAESLTDVLSLEQFIDLGDILITSVKLYAESKLDFVDCLLLAETNHSGRKLLTFDKALLKELDKHRG